MKFFRTSHPFVAAVITCVMALGLVATGRPALAHEGKCPVCKLDVPQDSDQLDQEVALKSGRKRIEYRCVQCALKDAPTFQGDVTILAPSELKGKPILLSRKDGKWSTTPGTIVFVAQKVEHKDCPAGYRAFTAKASAEAWVRKNPTLLNGAKPVGLAEMLEAAK